jgi:hypothetical protein
MDRPRGFQEVEATRFHESGHESVKVISPTHRPLLPPGNIRGSHFCLLAESTPGLKYGQKDYVNVKFQ